MHSADNYRTMDIKLHRATLQPFASMNASAYLSTGEFIILLKQSVVVFSPSKQESYYESNKILSGDFKSVIAYDDWVVMINYDGSCELRDLVDGGIDKVSDIVSSFGVVECGCWNNGTEFIICGEGCERFIVEEGLPVSVGMIELNLGESERIMQCVGENDKYVCVTNLNRVIKFNNDGVIESWVYDDGIVCIVYRDGEIGIVFTNSVLWKNVLHKDCGNMCIFETAAVVDSEVICFNSNGERFTTDTSNENNLVQRVMEHLDGNTVNGLLEEPSGFALFALYAPGVSITESVQVPRPLRVTAITLAEDADLLSDKLPTAPAIAASRRDSLLMLHGKPREGPLEPPASTEDDPDSPYETCPVSGRVLDRPGEIGECLWCRARVHRTGKGAQTRRCVFCFSRLRGA